MSVEFEPVRLRPRGRRLDPIAIAAIVVAVGLVAAVIKPWDDEASGPASSPGPVVEAGRSPVASSNPTGPEASIAIPRVIRPSAASAVTWSKVEPILHRREAWGIRAIVVQPLADTPLSARQRLIERWYPLPADGASGSSARVDSNDRSISALGLTFPPAHTPLDVRIWRETSGGLDWVDMAAVDPVPSGGAFLYVRPGLASGLQRPWEPGTYRVDVLVAGSVRRFGITIPDRFSNVPEPGDRPTLRSNGPLIEPASAALSDLPVGLFATADRVAQPLASVEGGPLDEVGAWLNVDPGTGRRPRSFVAETYLPRATGLGVAFPVRTLVTAAAIERVAPEPLATTPERVDPGADPGTPTSLVLFEAPDGAWAPGVYRLSVAWADFEGLHRGSWHVELRPGPVLEPSRLLAAARGWARFAGTTGVILGTTEPLADGLSAGLIEFVPLSPETAAYPVSTGIGCGGTVIRGRPGILGFAHAAEHYASRVTGRIVRPFLRRDDQVLMTAALGVRGLVLAAPARISSLPAANHEFTVHADDFAEVYSLCLGMAAFND